MTLGLPVLCGLVAAAVVLLWTQAAPGQATGDRPGGGASAAPSVPGASREPGDGEGEPAPRSSLREDARRLLSRLGVGRAERRRDAELQVLDGLAAALEAGLPVPQAVVLAVSQVDQRPDRQDDTGLAGGWNELARAAGQGQALAPVWHRLARRTASPTLHSVARAWRVAALTGAPLAGAIRVSAHASRERRRLERAVQVATAGARATVTVLTLLPLAGVGLAAVLGVPPTSLYSHPVALAGAGAGAVLVVVGQAWSRRMVGRVLHALT
ncbi:type II secretion system F family protein [Ornithinimicrobium pratense]|uniref:Type II secretion system protein GspF domain-containing protein n=1 Tax=Ornithinimicrobium pratense TaxID=2593973 RepID=A0A5J6V1T3_9MICO|nr:type II secretion system F family protein [Ornithinimicrobium pratense]QFG67595.1 hypothetical protein FY030_01605 [Ornithinimicrobium pratense]